MKPLTRRQFLSLIGKGVASGYVLLNVKHWSKWPLGDRGVVATGTGKGVQRLLADCLEALGGADRLASPGDVVAIKPTMAWNSPAAQAMNTNPEVIGALAELCLDAGARMVKIFDRASFRPELCYRVSGIPDALSELGSERIEVVTLTDDDFIPLHFADGSLPSRKVCRQVLEVDRFVNVSSARYHDSRGLSLSMPNLLGAVGGGPAVKGWDREQEVVSVAKTLRPDLSILDATRVRVDQGNGRRGSVEVRVMDTLAVSQDMVALDGFGCTLLDRSWRDVGYLRLAVEQNLGEAVPSLNEIRRVS